MPVAPIPVCRGAALADFQVGVLEMDFNAVIWVLGFDGEDFAPVIGVPIPLRFHDALAFDINEIWQIGVGDRVGQLDRLIGELRAKLGSAARFIGVSILGHRIFTGATAPL